MKIEIAIHCYNYQQRLNWMLSSILQQKLSSCELVISIAYTPNNGKPSTESLISYFKNQGLSIIDVVLQKPLIFNRAVSRNHRVRKTSADWIVFADADMIYETNFFETIARQLNTSFKYETRVIGADRHSLEIDYCVEFLQKTDVGYPCVIENVYDIVSQWPLSYIAHGRRAAGYFQLVNTTVLKAKTSFYSKDTIQDNIVYANYPSDKIFRQYMGGRVRMNTPKQYHLNHYRNHQEQK